MNGDEAWPLLAAALALAWITTLGFWLINNGLKRAGRIAALSVGIPAAGWIVAAIALSIMQNETTRLPDTKFLVLAFLGAGWGIAMLSTKDPKEITAAFKLSFWAGFFLLAILVWVTYSKGT